MKNYCAIYLFLLIFTSCSGYRIKKKENPFTQYNIEKIYIPMFYNQSNFVGVEALFTQKIYRTLLQYNKLEIVQSRTEADAVLIGILESRKKSIETNYSVSTKNVSNVYEDTLGQREKDFIVPTVNQQSIGLRIVIMKHPSNEEIEIVQSSLGDKVMSSKIIFNQKLNYNVNYTLKELQGDSIKVLGTQNRGVQLEAMNALANSAAEGFKEMVLYAF